MTPGSIRLTDPDLFGNDAAEDEDEAIFSSYAVERPELPDFLSVDRKICIAKAYKGQGKSALLRLTGSRAGRQAERPLVVSVSATSLTPSLDSTDFAAWVRGWKAAMLPASLPVRASPSCMTARRGREGRESYAKDAKETQKT